MKPGVPEKSYDNGFPSVFLVSWHSLRNGVMVIGEWEPGVLPATNTVKNGVCTPVNLTRLEVES